MKKTKTLLVCILCFIFVTIFTFGIFSVNQVNASAETDENYSAEEDGSEGDGEEGIMPQLFTSLSLGIDGGNGKVVATARNDITIFPSTVVVIVQLYYSDTYCEDYKDMTLISMTSTADLDMGQTISAEASTEGKVRFWIGRMRYKINSADWKEETVGPGKFSAAGEFLGYT